MSDAPQPVERDSRGILDPWLLRQRIQLTRYPAGPALTGLIDRFWAVQWDLPPGVLHRQQVLTHPGANLTVGHRDAHASANGEIEACCNGLARGLVTRVLAGRGWAVAAMTTPGGLGAFIRQPASVFTDRVVPLGQAIGSEELDALRLVSAAPDEVARVGVLAEVLEEALDPQRVPIARQVASIAKQAEIDRSVRRLSDLCAQAGVGQRSLQRMFTQYAGVSPTWVLRRYRLLDAAEAVRAGQPVSWAELAAGLGYADQAHLIRDFRAAIGTTPERYARIQRCPRS